MNKKQRDFNLSQSKAQPFLDENGFNERKEIMQWVMDEALRLGANEVGLQSALGHSLGVSSRNEEIESFDHSISNDFSLAIYCDNKFSVHNTNDFNKDSLSVFIKTALEYTRSLETDEFRRLPSPETYFQGENFEQLEQFDADYATISLEEKMKYPLLLEKQLRALKSPWLLSSSAHYNDEQYYSLLMLSNGFSGYQVKSYYGLSLSATVKDESDMRPSGFDFAQSRFSGELHSFLHDPKMSLAPLALRRAEEKLNPKVYPSGRYNTIVSFEAVGKLLSPILSAISGKALEKKQSFLLDSVGKTMFSPLFTLVDDPLQKGQIGGMLYNKEGQKMCQRELISQGRVNEYLVGNYYANKLQLKQTGNSFGTLSILPGNLSAIELQKKMNNGILIQGFNGGNCNLNTGDFSYGIEGQWIENGETVSAITEMNVSGNMLDLWKNLNAVGNDALMNTARQFPSLLFDKLDFSGV